MSVYHTITTVYKEKNLLTDLRMREKSDNNLCRSTGLFNDGKHCDLNSALLLIIAMGESEKLELVINSDSSTPNAKQSMKQTVEIAKKYLTTDIDRMPEEDKDKYMDGIYTMHLNKLYESQIDIRWPNTRLSQDEYGKELMFLSENSSNWEEWSKTNYPTIVSDNAVITWLKFIHLQYGSLFYRSMLNNIQLPCPDIELIDFSYNTLDIYQYHEQMCVLMPKHQIKLSFHSEFMLTDGEYYTYILEQCKQKLLASKARTVLIKIMSPLTWKHKPKDFTIIISAKDDVKEYKLKAVSYLTEYELIGHFGSLYVQEDGSVINVLDLYKHTFKLGLQDNSVQDLLYGANLFVYTLV